MGAEAAANDGDGEESAGGGGAGGGGGGGRGFFSSKLWQQTMRRLSNLPLALGEMAVLAGLSSIGTVIEQNKARMKSCNEQATC